MLLSLYRTATRLGGPLIALHLWRRARWEKEDASRLDERFGEPGATRPDGPLLWMHAASVGESLAALPLVEALLANRPMLQILVTTGTVTSAKLMASRLPPGAVHQFVPVDRPDAWQRFFGFWRPDLACLIESEIWPNMILEAAASNLPLVLINGRLSPRSFKRWRVAKSAAAQLFGQFELCLARSESDGERLRALGAVDVRCLGDLKDAAPPLPVDDLDLEEWRSLLRERTVWLAASTHPGEEQQILAVHKMLASNVPNLLTIIVPRHPERGDQLAAEIEAAGLNVAQRSLRMVPDHATSVYLADTLGELGLFYRLVPIAFIGGSLVAHGGQNPLEAIRLACPTLFGPHTVNFEETTGHMEQLGCARRVDDTADLAKTLRRLLTDDDALASMTEQARQVGDGGQAVLERILNALSPLLDRRISPARLLDPVDSAADACP